MNDQHGTSNPQLFLDADSKEFLLETSKWAKFIAILGFIGIALMVLMAIFVSLFFNLSGLSSNTAADTFGFGTGFLGLIYLVLAALYFFPILYLYRFSDQIKKSILDSDQLLLSSALEHLKKHYKFIGIIAIAIIALYAVLFLIAMFGGIASAF